MTNVPDHFWDFMEDGDFPKFAEQERKMSLEGQVIALAAKNAELLMALEEIAKKRKMDAVAASSMRAIAREALTAAGIKVRL